MLTLPAKLATWQLPSRFQSQIPGEHAAGGLGRLQVPWGSNTVAMNGRVDFLKKKFPTSDQLALGRPLG